MEHLRQDGAVPHAEARRCRPQRPRRRDERTQRHEAFPAVSGVVVRRGLAGLPVLREVEGLSLIHI